jgi:hypothetical protein
MSPKLVLSSVEKRSALGAKQAPCQALASAKSLFFKTLFFDRRTMMAADSVRGQNGRTRGRGQDRAHLESGRGIERRPERLRDNLSESNFIQCGNIDAGCCNHFGLVNRNIGHGKARDHSSITGDKARRPSLIVVRPRGYGRSVLKNLGECLTVWDSRQKACHCRGIIEPSRRTGNCCAHAPTITEITSALGDPLYFHLRLNKVTDWGSSKSISCR